MKSVKIGHQEWSNTMVWAYYVCYLNDEVDRSGYNPLCGFSVRCVKN